MSATLDDARHVLQRYFGYPDFRGGRIADDELGLGGARDAEDGDGAVLVEVVVVEVEVLVEVVVVEVEVLVEVLVVVVLVLVDVVVVEVEVLVVVLVLVEVVLVEVEVVVPDPRSVTTKLS